VNRPVLTDPAVLEALAHPVRLDLLTHLISAGPATASDCARAVGDTPSNCSYHLRTLARHGLVQREASGDRRQRPWRATITGFAIDPVADPASPEGRGAAAVLSASVALEQRRLRDHLSHRDRLDLRWRGADLSATYTLRATPEQVRALGRRLDALIRPLIALGEGPEAPGSELVHFTVYAFPRTVVAASEPTSEPALESLAESPSESLAESPAESPAAADGR
jgi:DNA-binding transcriptional ArsR family regulator